MKKGIYGSKKVFIMIVALIFIVLGPFGTKDVATKSNQISTVSSTASLNLHTISISDTTVSLAWDLLSSKDKIINYEIYMNDNIIDTTNKSTYLVTKLAPSTTYQLFVRAKLEADNSIKSNTLILTTAVGLPTSTKAIEPTIIPIPTPEQAMLPTEAPPPTATSTPTIAPAPTQASAPISKSGYKIIGYYAAWAAYSGYTPDKIDPNKLTHINYAFAYIGSDYKIKLGFPDVDIKNIDGLNALKQTNPNLKILISVGGWSWSKRFPDAALSEKSRSIFADSCVDFLVRYGLDGIDIDWEYPVSGGLSTNARRPEDKQNFTLLLQKLREKLDTRSAIDGKDYLLSFAGASENWYLTNIEPNKIVKYVDYVNVMTYDIHGIGEAYTDFNAPLYNSSESSPQYKWSVDRGIDAWLNTGFPADKIVMGVPFYGYLYKAVDNVNNGLYQTYSEVASISYANIAASYLKAPGYVHFYHEESMVPWLFNGSTFISYEDDQSMEYKAQYVKTQELGGAMIWELSQDPNKVLLNALYNKLK